MFALNYLDQIICLRVRIRVNYTLSGYLHENIANHSNVFLRCLHGVYLHIPNCNPPWTYYWSGGHGLLNYINSYYHDFAYKFYIYCNIDMIFRHGL